MVLFNSDKRELTPEKPYRYMIPSTPVSDMGTVLVTGASGYVGGRLVPVLMDRGYKVRVMVRTPSTCMAEQWPGVKCAAGDALHLETLKKPLEGIHSAFYLIHSLALGPDQFDEADILAASNFRKAAEEAGVKRIIYLGGLGDLTPGLSDHLSSRIKVAFTLNSSSIPVTVLRAAVIIGSGSASYEIIHSLIKRLRILPLPRFVDRLCQPISIRDVLKYLVGVLETPETIGRSFDIGGADVLTYRAMMKEFARLLNRRVAMFNFPFSYIPLYAYIASLVTPVPAPIIRSLMEGLRNDVVCRDQSIRTLISIRTIGYREALIRAMDREEQDQVRTRWAEAYPPAHELAIKLREMRRLPQFTATYSLETDQSSASLFQSVCRIGGKEGWFQTNWMWRLRGFMDRLIGGVGTQRGRRSTASLKIGDVIDFWRVEDLIPDSRLLLRAEMLLPGRAWLEFNIHDNGTTRSLKIKAWFHTRTLFGKIYWYVLVPFHGIVFNDLIKGIEKAVRKT
ncbi:MAG: SDR family oxidoreductase [Acidobacteria bacterium]|nr:SDR family oxidoreductase [Acidobacteriota bacterium]